MEEVQNDYISDKDLIECIPEPSLKLVDTLFKQCKFSEIIHIIKPTLEKFHSGSFSYQIIFSIYLFCLIKLQINDQLKEVKTKKYDKNTVIFPLLFLQAKYFFIVVYNIFFTFK